MTGFGVSGVALHMLCLVRAQEKANDFHISPLDEATVSE
jgi:hypothetical protein